MRVSAGRKVNPGWTECRDHAALSRERKFSERYTDSGKVGICKQHINEVKETGWLGG